MPSPDLNGGMPRIYIEPTDNREALQTRYGNYAISVLVEVGNAQDDFPEDILVIGDNWFQLSNYRDQPGSDVERQLARTGLEMFGDMWPIMERDETILLSHILSDIQRGVQARSLDDRIMDKVAVLDLTSIASSVIDEAQVTHVGNYSWGRIMQLKGYRTMIYQITQGFTRKSTQDLIGTTPADDSSVAIFWNNQAPSSH